MPGLANSAKEFPMKVFPVGEDDWKKFIDDHAAEYAPNYLSGSKVSVPFKLFLPRITRGEQTNSDNRGDKVNYVRLCTEYIPAGKAYKFKINVPGFIYRTHFFGNYTADSRVGILVSDDETFQTNVHELMRSDGAIVNGKNVNSHGNVMFPIVPNREGKSTYVMIFGNGTAEENAPQGYPDRDIYFIPAYGEEDKSIQAMIERYGTFVEHVPMWFGQGTSGTPTNLTKEVPDPSIQYYNKNGDTYTLAGDGGYISEFTWPHAFSMDTSKSYVIRYGTNRNYNKGTSVYILEQTLFDIPSKVVPGARESIDGFKNIFGTIADDAFVEPDEAAINTFPQKLIVAPEEENPIDYLAKKLDDQCKRAYPAYVGKTVKSIFPDIVNAKIVDAKTIYRSNAPGYFYQAITDCTDSTDKIGVIRVSKTSLTIDCRTIATISHFNAVMAKVYDEHGHYSGTTIAYWQSEHSFFRPKIFQSIQNIAPDGTDIAQMFAKNLTGIHINSEGEIPADAPEWWKKLYKDYCEKNKPKDSSGNTITAPTDRLKCPGVPVNVKKSRTDYSKDAFSYAVSIGSSIRLLDGKPHYTGGHINSMIPILPGVGLSSNPASETEGVVEYNRMHIAVHGHYFANEVMSWNCGQTSKSYPGGSEGEGTFFTYCVYDGKSATPYDNSLYFIPTLAASAYNKSVNPITRIRDVVQVVGADNPGGVGPVNSRLAVNFDLKPYANADEEKIRRQIQSYSIIYDLLYNLTDDDMRVILPCFAGDHDTKPQAGYTTKVSISKAGLEKLDTGGMSDLSSNIKFYTGSTGGWRDARMGIGGNSSVVNYFRNNARRMGINSEFRSIFSAPQRAFTTVNGYTEVAGFRQKFVTIGLNKDNIKSFTESPPTPGSNTGLTDHFDSLVIFNPKDDDETAGME